MFEGRKIKKLLSELIKSYNESDSLRIMEELSEFGKTAMPIVVRSIRSRELNSVKGMKLVEKILNEYDISDLLPLTADEFDIVRGLAKKITVTKWKEEAIPKLLENLQHKDAFIRASATEILTEMRNQSTVLKLVSLFNENDIELKKNIIKILSATGGQVATKLLITALKEKDRSIRFQAVRGLSKMKDPSSVEPIIEILNDDDVQIKKCALDTLWAIGDSQAAIAIVPHLNDKDLLVRQKAVDCIIKIGDSSIVSQIYHLLKDPDVNVRRCTVEILNNLNDPRTGEELIKVMKDSDWWVRQRATDALAELKGSNVVKYIIVMLNESDEAMRRCAVEFFNKVSDPSSFEPLVQALKDDDWWVREKAITALGKLKDPRALEPLMSMMGDEEIKWVLPSAFADIGGEKAIEEIGKLLKDSQKLVRLESLKAIEKLKELSLVDDIKDLLNDCDDEVCNAAIKVLKEVTGKTFQPEEESPKATQPLDKMMGSVFPEGSILTEAIVVVDLCNSTGIANKYGDQFALNLTKILTDAVRSIIDKEGFQFMKSTGDGFLITFTTIEIAIRFSLTLTNIIGKYNQTADKRSVIDLRFAINLGETRIDAKGDRLGVAVNMTFRVEGVKPDDMIEIEGGIKKEQMPVVNRILVTENVAEEVRKYNNISVTLLGLFELKGITGLHRVFELKTASKEG